MQRADKLLFEKGYMAFTLFMVYADRADAATAKLIANEQGRPLRRRGLR